MPPKKIRVQMANGHIEGTYKSKSAMNFFENIEYIRADTVIDPDKVEQLVEALEKLQALCESKALRETARDAIAGYRAQYHKE